MAATATPYGIFQRTLLSGGYNTTTDAFKVMLLSDAYTPDIDLHESVADVNANEVGGTGYTSGGVALSGLVLNYDTTSHNETLSADPVTWIATTVTFRYAAVYKVGADAASSPLIGYIDYGVQTMTNSDFGLSFSNGLIRVNRTA